MDPYLAHYLTICNNVVLPGQRRRFLIGDMAVGWVLPSLATELAAFRGISATANTVRLAADPTGELQTIARTLADRGRFRWRGEAFDVRSEPDGVTVGHIDRGAMPIFGMLAQGVHVNGLVRHGDETLIWVARRAASKALDPGKLDNIVAGGIPAGLTPYEALIKEAAEEAAIPADLAANAVAVETIQYTMERPEGLRRDLLHCYDLYLPEDFVPKPIDGEVESFELWPASRVLDAVRHTTTFKFNVNLVLIGLFRRLGLTEPTVLPRTG